MLSVTVVDYGASNLLNVVRALEYCGASPKIVTTEHEIRKADRLVLPGVGAFQDGMNSLQDKGLATGIIDYMASERPYLGICLGMQFLFERSYEFGLTEGLGLLAGEVCPIPNLTNENRLRRVPHIGWSPIHLDTMHNNFSSPLLKDIKIGESFYFIHSFMCVPQNKGIISSVADYLGLLVPASISYNNMHGTQFHPEKSGEAGLKVLHNFLRI